jgi:hypothetical protein
MGAEVLTERNSMVQTLFFLWIFDRASWYRIEILQPT